MTCTRRRLDHWRPGRAVRPGRRDERTGPGGDRPAGVQRGCRRSGGRPAGRGPRIPPGDAGRGRQHARAPGLAATAIEGQTTAGRPGHRRSDLGPGPGPAGRRGRRRHARPDPRGGRRPAGLGITDREVRDEVATLFVAGHDTTSAALAWLWFALSQHPDIERRVLDEVDRLGPRPVRHADLPRLRYTEMVVKESMRCIRRPRSCSGGRRSRTLNSAATRSAAGAGCSSLPTSCSGTRGYFPDPQTFDPERFAPARADRIVPYSYLVFGAGPRTCIGNALATTELVLVAATVLQRIRLILDQAPPEPEMEVVLRPRGGLRMRAEPRAEGRLAVPA